MNPGCDIQFLLWRVLSQTRKFLLLADNMKTCSGILWYIPLDHLHLFSQIYLKAMSYVCYVAYV